MKELSRLLLLGALAFLVVSLAIFVGKPSIFPDVERILARWRFSDPAEGDDRVWIARPQGDSWMGLAGFPNRTEVYFAVPPALHPLSGKLHLDLQTQLATAGDGRVSISINDRPVDELVLPNGQRNRSLSYDLQPEDLQQPWIRIGLNSTGSTGGGQVCPVGAVNSGSAVAVLASSGLALQLSAPLSDLQARLAALSDPLTVAYPTAAEGQSLAIWSMAYLGRRGIGMQLIDDAASAQLALQPTQAEALAEADGKLTLGGTAGTTLLATLRNGRPKLADIKTWPVSIDTLTDDTLSRTFRGSRRWSIPYTLADLPAGQVPTVLKLSIKTSRLMGEVPWIARVSLNGNLISSFSLPGATDQHDLSIPLPADLQGLTNSVDIALIDGSPQADICAQRPDVEAQLLPVSQLETASPVSGNLKFDLVRKLAGLDALTISQNGANLALPAGYQAGNLLAKLLPLNVPVSLVADGAIVEISDAASLPDRLARLRSAGNIVAVYADPRERVDGIGVRRLSDLSDEALGGIARQYGAVIFIGL